MSRTAIACAVGLGAATAWLSACSDATSPPVLTVTAVAVSEGQGAMAGNRLPLPLSVLVRSDGAAKAGVMVTWSASAGTISPRSSVTDLTGIASATWTLGGVPGTVTGTATVAGAQGSPLTFHAIAVPPLRLVAVPASNGQTGTVGKALPQPLQVRVDFNGAPRAGISVHWRAAAGSVNPGASISDSNGIASAIWTLGTAIGHTTAYVALDGTPTSEAFFATALPGPAFAIKAVDGSGQTTPANRRRFNSLLAAVTDQYGNRVEGQAVDWTIESGPVAFVTTGGATDKQGLSATLVEPSGGRGEAVVRAALPGGAASADFALTVSPPVYDVTLHTSAGFAFVSSQNGSFSPAVDTIPAGRTMTWTLEFDYDLHSVTSVGTPSFTGGEFPYANPSTVSVTFANPGTYSYRDRYHHTVTGIVVVQ